MQIFLLFILIYIRRTNSFFRRLNSLFVMASLSQSGCVPSDQDFADFLNAVEEERQQEIILSRKRKATPVEPHVDDKKRICIIAHVSSKFDFKKDPWPQRFVLTGRVWQSIPDRQRYPDQKQIQEAIRTGEVFRSLLLDDYDLDASLLSHKCREFEYRANFLALSCPLLRRVEKTNPDLKLKTLNHYLSLDKVLQRDVDTALFYHVSDMDHYLKMFAKKTK